MDKPSFKLVGTPCGQHGQYTFYKAVRISGETERILAIGDFFFVKIWQDSELISIGELQLLWTDRVSDQTLVSLRLYFLPENTPDGRNQHGEDEVLAINDKVVVRAEDLLSWICTGHSWSTGLRAVWRGACAPPQETRHTAPLHHTKLDFTDVDSEKSTIAIDSDAPGVVVFSYPRYCRYRALLSRLEGIQGDWLRDSLVAALGGYAAPTNNTRILYCKDTFEYPQLEEHEFVCNHLAPKLKGRPRGRRKRPPRSQSHSPSSRSSDSDVQPPPFHEPRTPQTPRRLSLRNGTEKSEEEDDKLPQSEEDRAFLREVRRFHRDRGGAHVTNLRDMSLRSLYTYVAARGGHAAVSAARAWRGLHTCRPARARHHYERFLLPYEIHERKTKNHMNGKIEDTKPDTIDVPDSPLRDSPKPEKVETKPEIPEKILRTPSPTPKEEKKEKEEDADVTSKPAEELNREFLDSLPPKEEKVKISVKPVEKLIAPENNVNTITKLFEENSGLINELSAKYNVKEVSKVVEEIGSRQLSDGSTMFLSELAQRLNFGNADTTVFKELSAAQQQLISSGGNALSSLSALSEKYASQGHATDQKNNKPAGRSSLRHVRVRPSQNANSGTLPRAGSSSSQSSSSPPAAAPHAPTAVNFGIHRAPPQPPAASVPTSQPDDDIVEVPYKPKTPEIIDLDEYPESPQTMKKKKLDILKERGLEVTALPTWGGPVPLLAPPAVALAPAVQHQIMTQASLFHMYNVIPPNYANGIQPPKVIQATSIFGSSGPEKTVYGNPKDPFMPPPHVLHGTPVKPQKVHTSTPERPQDILDLTCKTLVPSQKPAVEIVRIPPAPSPSKNVQNLSKNYTLVDGKAVVGSNLEITLVNPKTANTTPVKTRPPQKRSSNGKFVSTKTPPPKPTTPTSVKKPPIVVPNYQINRDDVSPTSSTGSRDSQTNLQNLQNLQNSFKTQPNLSQIMDMQKNMPLTQNLSQIMDMQKNMPMTQIPFMDPLYMSALYNSLAGQMDQRQLAMYRDLMTSQIRNYSGLLGSVTPTTKN